MSNRATNVRAGIVLAVALASRGLFADVLTWTGNQGASLNNSNNWSPVQAPASGDSLVFGNSVVGSTNPSLDSSIAVQSILFNGTCSFTLFGPSNTTLQLLEGATISVLTS